MDYKIINTCQSDLWNSLLSRQETTDIYFSPQYHASFESSMQRQGTAFSYESGGESFFYPFMLGEVQKVGRQQLKRKYRDTETVYGYSGPLTTSYDEQFLAESAKAFYEYCAEENIICGLLRFHPLIENHRIKCEKTSLLLNRRTVSMDLNNAEELWKNYHPKLRNDLRRGEKMGLVVEEDAIEIEEFIQLYEITMRRLVAPEFYIFKHEHYDVYKDGSLSKKFSVKHDGKVIAASIFLLGTNWLHYHLSANSGSELQPYASKMIIHQAALWGIENGFEKFHLGGGRTPDLDDNLLFFKKRFSNIMHDFYIGKTITDQPVYRELCDIWRNQADYEPLPLLQIYRLPISQQTEMPVKVAV